jgi:hypothetical protein
VAQLNQRALHSLKRVIEYLTSREIAAEVERGARAAERGRSPDSAALHPCCALCITPAPGGRTMVTAWRCAMNSSRTFLAALAALLSACGSVMTSAPLPQSALDMKQREQFEGVWVFSHGEGPTYLVAFACDGTARLGAVAWEQGRFKTAQTLLSIALDKDGAQGGPGNGAQGGPVESGPAESGAVESGFLTIQGEKQKDWPGYTLLRYRFLSPDDLIVWVPITKPFDDAIKAGRLQGKTYREVTEITGPPQALLDFLRDPANPPLFDYENPLLFMKVAGISGETEQHGCAKP